jgi:5-methylcytosine-specific restriction enzyme subunit McrC
MCGFIMTDGLLPQHRIYRGREHSEIAVPLANLLREGKLNIFDEVRGRKYFQLYSKGADLVFQCGGFVGLIPINDQVSIEVAPRINISNLDRILSKAGAEHVLIQFISRSYAATEEAVYLVDLLADSLSNAVEEISDWGKYKEYSKHVSAGHPRSGRILVKETVRLRAKSPGNLKVVTARFERSANNVFNACIKLAIERLLNLFINDAKLVRTHAALISRLNVAWLSFREIDVPGREIDIVRHTGARLNNNEELNLAYQKALPLALAVLRGLGPSQRDLPPNLSLGSLIFDLADAFERYVRQCLFDWSIALIKDGNLGHPLGAKKNLFDKSEHPIAKKILATPDIVIRSLDGERILAVLDAKYKAYRGMPDREDINQAISYAAIYGCEKCGLIFLSSESIGRTERYGTTGGIEVFGLSIALGAADLAAEEERFAREACALFGIQSKQMITLYGRTA